MDALPNLASLSLDSPTRLETLPIALLRIIFRNLDTAQSFGRLAQTSKSLKQIVEHHGWNVFVRTHFDSRSLPPGNWKTVARRLSWQNRAWERRALILSSLVSPKKLAQQSSRGRGGRGGRGGRQGRPAQTFPPSVILDASSHTQGRAEHELLAWGIGEDVVLRWRELHHSVPKKEKWTHVQGEVAGFKAGQDDVSALALLKDPETKQAQMMLAGRASGYLQLLSTHQKDMGRTIAWLQPEPADDSPTTEQKEVQHIDANMAQYSAAVATKDSLFFYPLLEQWPNPKDLNLDENGNPAEFVIHPVESLNVKSMQDSAPFQQIRQVCNMQNGDVALALSGTTQPLRYLTRTPSGTVIANSAKMQASSRCSQSYIYDDHQTQTSRCILALDTSFLPGGSSYTTLSSYDDGPFRTHHTHWPAASRRNPTVHCWKRSNLDTQDL
ncbi:hypothetical protein NQ176_g9159 [Zarea fungicola]|uniref:Uncharacterized protein n=1 Tax=Zarea fungicola TaxID=93591 RepID=A0ACC1MPM0_9HYPO|nr:hypothetical protein NQ176_g9159 [Lecanicillium fungicola]